MLKASRFLYDIPQDRFKSQEHKRYTRKTDIKYRSSIITLDSIKKLTEWLV